MAARRKPTSKLKRKRDTRPSAAKRGYNYKWQKSRKKKLAGKKCSVSGCTKKATHLHHTSYSPARTKPMCTSHHNAHTARNKHKKGKR